MRNQLLLGLLLLSACNVVSSNSNDPDSGVVCPANTSPGGTGALQGSNGFTVAAAYQNANRFYTPDGGAVTGASLTLQLLRNARSCAQVQDAGSFGDGLFATVFDLDATAVKVGSYQTLSQTDGGAYFVGYLVQDGGLAPVAEGTLTLGAIADCASSGSVDFHVRTEDGGVTPLTGTFNAEFCKGR